MDQRVSPYAVFLQLECTSQARSWTYCCKSDTWANMWQVTVSGGRATRTLAGRRSQCSPATWAFPRNACTLLGWDLCSQTPDQPGPTGLFLRTLSLAQEETPVKTPPPPLHLLALSPWPETHRKHPSALLDWGKRPYTEYIMLDKWLDFTEPWL